MLPNSSPQIATIPNIEEIPPGAVPHDRAYWNHIQTHHKDQIIAGVFAGLFVTSLPFLVYFIVRVRRSNMKTVDPGHVRTTTKAPRSWIRSLGRWKWRTSSGIRHGERDSGDVELEDRTITRNAEAGEGKCDAIYSLANAESGTPVQAYEFV